MGEHVSCYNDLYPRSQSVREMAIGVRAKEGRKEVTERVVKEKRSIEEEEAPQKCSSNVPTLKCDPGNYQSELNAPTMYLGSIAYRWCFHNSGLISPTTPFGQCNDDDDARQEF